MDDYAFAQESEADAAVHLAYDHLDLACWSRRMPLAKECKLRLVVGPDAGEPVFEGEQSMAVCHHLGE